jgi:hypothetical protein
MSFAVSPAPKNMSHKSIFFLPFCLPSIHDKIQKPGSWRLHEVLEKTATTQLRRWEATHSNHKKDGQLPYLFLKKVLSNIIISKSSLLYHVCYEGVDETIPRVESCPSLREFQVQSLRWLCIKSPLSSTSRLFTHFSLILNSKEACRGTGERCASSTKTHQMRNPCRVSRPWSFKNGFLFNWCEKCEPWFLCWNRVHQLPWNSGTLGRRRKQKVFPDMWKSLKNLYECKTWEDRAPLAAVYFQPAGPWTEKCVELVYVKWRWLA